MPDIEKASNGVPPPDDRCHHCYLPTPGPFSMKEHVIIAIFANSAAITIMKAYYKQSLTFLLALFIDASKFPIFSNQLFTHSGQKYDITKILAKEYNLNSDAYNKYSIKDICLDDETHRDSPWTCPKYRVTFDASVIWGLIGPRQLFGPGGLYRNLVWLFLTGAVLPVPVWVFSKIYPDKKWIPLINMPIILSGFAGMPPATPTNIGTWLLTRMIFNFFVFRFYKCWWQKYNYVLSVALDAGTALMGVLIFFALQNAGHSFKWWGTKIDHCPLASCPTAPGIMVDGCPVF